MNKTQHHEPLFPGCGLWVSADFVCNGDPGTVHDNLDNGVRVISTPGVLSVSFIPERFRVPNAPHPLVPERATDAHIAIVMRDFAAQAYVEGEPGESGVRIFWAPGFGEEQL